ncbi:MAG: hypothetical protein F6K42_24945 [Leptolyngbya sp. SIO1D8]|nr:hypothetical protein [Leptolyngbya sp. SIO1D8]
MMSTPRLVVALLIICGLVTVALQNTSPSLALVFLSFRTATLPLGVWLSGAIILGALTTMVLTEFTISRERPSQRPRRRRWRVSPNPTDQPGSAGRRSSSQDTPRRSTSSAREKNRSKPQPSPRDPAAAEDWQAWGQRIPASQWEDWSQSGSPEPTNQTFSKRQRRDKDKAENTIKDLSDGWDSSAQDTVYVAPGGSAVDDVLDDIAEGWDDWDSETASPSETAYSYRYRGDAASSRADQVYGPPDDAVETFQEFQSAPASGDDNEDWGLEPDETSAGKPWTEKTSPHDPGVNSEDNEEVYDADYRVIIPPYRPLEEDTEDDRDRTP